MTHKTKFLFAFFVLLNSLQGSAQLKWTGTSDNDFFNEANWYDLSTNKPPASGAIDPSTNIDVDLEIVNAPSLVTAVGIIQLGTGQLVLNNSSLKVDVIHGGKVEVVESYIHIENSHPIQNNVVINIHSGNGWVRLLNKNSAKVYESELARFTIDGTAANYPSNIRLDNYYRVGTVIRSGLSTVSPLTIFSKANQTGQFAKIEVGTIHKGKNIPASMNNKMNSFSLKRGFSLVLATNEDGSGKSKNFIASETDLVINELPAYLQNNVSFIRLVPWNWVSKKGIGGTSKGLNETWFYQWSSSGNSSLAEEYVPMAWGKNAIDSDADVQLFIGKYKSTHALAFNESDHCEGQSGQYGDLCKTDVAAAAYLNLPKTGLRMISPSCRENAPFGWLKEWYDKTILLDGRVDVIGVHWYDWGSNPAANPNHSATVIFDRFKAYLKNVHDLYNLPIWITEFNANPNRSNATNLAFMQLALPYLETLDYVERYAWFQPNSGVADYYDSDGNYTNVGAYYRDFVSSSSMPENTYADKNSMDFRYGSNISDGNLLINGGFENGNKDFWKGYNNTAITDGNVRTGNAAGRISSGDGSFFREESVEPNRKYKVSFYSKWNAMPTAQMNVRVLDHPTGNVLLTTPIPAATQYELVEMSFVVPANVDSIKIQFYKPAGQPTWFLDDVTLSIAEGGSYVEWLGAVDSDWNKSANWSLGFVPDGSNNVIIPQSTNMPTIDQGAYSVNNLELKDGAVLVLNGTANLTVLENMTANTGYVDVTFGASLLLKGTAIGNNHRFSRATTFSTTTGKYSVIGSPIVSGNTSSLGGLVYSYDENVAYAADGSNRFVRAQNANMSAGDAFFSASTGNVTFTGVPNTGTITQPLIYNATDGENAGFNLISNPYTAAIDLDRLMTENNAALSSQTIYIWDDGGSNISQRSNSDYIVINSLGATRVNANGRENGWDKGIRAMQGFFIKAKELVDFKFTTDMLIENKNDAVAFYRHENTSVNTIRLSLADENNYSDCLVGLKDDATLGFDQKYDAIAMQSNAPLKVNSLLDEEALAIQGLPGDSELMFVDLSVETAYKGLFEFQLTDGGFDGYSITLLDHVANKSVNLTTGGYSFTADAKKDHSRFQLVIAREDVLSELKASPSDHKIFAADDLLKIQLQDGVDNAKIHIMDIGGQRLREYHNVALVNGHGQVDFRGKGLFLVRIITNKEVITRKIVSYH
ncbi:MAG: glycosyl hydrolase [Cyclobacteriaceae bacterium]